MEGASALGGTTFGGVGRGRHPVAPNTIEAARSPINPYPRPRTHSDTARSPRSVSRLVRHQQKGWVVGMQERTASAAEDQFLQPCATIEAHDHKVAAERLDLSLNDLAGI